MGMEGLPEPPASPRSAPGRCSRIGEVRSDISATLAARLAPEPRFEIGQANVVRPIRRDDPMMGAPIVGAIDLDPAQAGSAHRPKVIFWMGMQA